MADRKAQESRQQFDELRAKIATTSEEFVSRTMPDNILRIDRLIKDLFGTSLETPPDVISPIVVESKEGHSAASENDSASSASKKRKLRRNSDAGAAAAATTTSASPGNSHAGGSDGARHHNTTVGEFKPIPCNKRITELLTVLKAEILKLTEVIGTVKFWIQLNIPRIEDGNNFGVSVQEDAVSELGRAEDAGFELLETITKYYVSRGKLISKVLKHPEVEDYRQSVIELDEKQFINTRLHFVDLRNNYAVLYDMIMKNYEKIKQPRSNNYMPNMV